MQLERIRIEGLFGRFNHDVTFRRPEQITIIHAPNGFGKTVLLTLINAFFSQRFYMFFKYQFRSLTFHFDTHEIVEIRKDRLPDLFDKAHANDIHVILQSNVRQFVPFTLKSRLEPQLKRYLPFLEPIGPDQWLDERDEEILSTTEAIDKYCEHLPDRYVKSLEIPEWFKEIVSSFDCRLIETQRLLRIPRFDEEAPPHRRSSPTPRPVVDMEARDLARRIGATLAEYANRAQSLDQSFPRRVLACSTRFSTALSEGCFSSFEKHRTEAIIAY